MTTTLVTLTGDVTDAIGTDFDARRTKAYVRHNTPKIVTDDGPIHLGGGTVNVNDDGTFELPNVVASTSLVENLQATVYVDYDDPTIRNNGNASRKTATFGPYDLSAETGTVDIRTLEAVQALDPSYASETMAAMQALLAEMEEISGLTGEDEAVAFLIEDEGSDTAAALSASIDGRALGSAGTGLLRSQAVADGTDQSATIAAEAAAFSMFGGGVLLLPPGVIRGWAEGVDNVTIQGAGVDATMLMLPDGANLDVIAATGCTGFVVQDLTIHGNRAEQTLTDLTDANDTDPAKATKGIAFYGCTRSGVRRVRVVETRFHGVFYTGGDGYNFFDDLHVSDVGVDADDCFGAGVKVHSAIKVMGRKLVAIDCRNSGLSTDGGEDGDGCTFTDIHAAGGISSAITINTTNARLSDLFASVDSDTWTGGTPSTDSAALNIGHAVAGSEASGIYVVNGELTGSPRGLSVGNCVDGQFANLRVHDNALSNLNVFGDLAGRLQLTNCDFDTTTSTAGGGANGVGVVLTSSGAAAPPGSITMVNCRIASSIGRGVLVAGLSNVILLGGVVEDNTGVGFEIVDNTSLAAGNLAIGVVFRDTRSGGSRTQTVPFSCTSTGGGNAALLYRATNHATSNSPSAAGANDMTLGTSTGDKLLLAGGGGAFDIVKAISRIEAPISGITAANPGVSFTSRPTQGFFSLGANTVGGAAAGVESWRFDNAKWRHALPVRSGAFTTAGRPAASTVDAGASYWDTTLNKEVATSDASTWNRETGYVLYATATLDFPSVSAAGSQELTITVTGAAVGDTVALGAPAAIEVGLVWNGYVSATNTVTVRLSNITGSPIDPASTTWKATILR